MDNYAPTNEYTIIRKIGEGGFGEVFVAKKGETYCAVKRLFPQAAKREILGIKKFFALANGAKDFPLVEILGHWNNSDGTFSYSMPLSDGFDNSVSPESPFWFSKTLYSEIERQSEEPKWLSREYIENVAGSLFDAACFLSRHGILHRDIKPENILFFGGRPKLADIGLLVDDTPNVSVMGTPDYLPPSWYLRTHGDPDMWGVAATLYTLITGFSPDTLGREAYMFPRQNKKLLSPDEIERWKHWHACILRATHERAAERFRNIEDFKACFFGKKLPAEKTAFSTVFTKRKWILPTFAILGIAALASYSVYATRDAPKAQTTQKIEQVIIEEYYKKKSRVYPDDFRNAISFSFNAKHKFPEYVEIKGFTQQSLNDGTYDSLKQKTIEKYINDNIDDLIDIDESVKYILKKSLDDIKNALAPYRISLPDYFEYIVSKEEIHRAFAKSQPITKEEVCERAKQAGVMNYFSERKPAEYIEVKDYPKYKAFEDKFKAYCKWRLDEIAQTNLKTEMRRIITSAKKMGL